MTKNLKVKYRRTAELVPYINNARTHSDFQVKQIAASIREFGFTNPVLIDEKSNIVAGHGRVMAAEILELDQVPTITLKGLTDAQRRAYVIADNKLALNAGWEPELLKLELEVLQNEDFNLEVLGFGVEELQSMFDMKPLTDNEAEQGDSDPTLRVVQFVLRIEDFDPFMEKIEAVLEKDPELANYPSKHGGVIVQAVRDY